uniref:Uncharacterized protein n=1 Tax=Rhizophora mucronata TaxID=61149 RepID=A0A2P2QI55_RHIMU
MDLGPQLYWSVICVIKQHKCYYILGSLFLAYELAKPESYFVCGS